jgi:hypothetical protein
MNKSEALAKVVGDFDVKYGPLGGKVVAHPPGYEACESGTGSCNALNEINRLGKLHGRNIQARHFFERRYIVIVKGPAD